MSINDKPAPSNPIRTEPAPDETASQKRPSEPALVSAPVAECRKPADEKKVSPDRIRASSWTQRTGKPFERLFAFMQTYAPWNSNHQEYWVETDNDQ